MGRGFDATAVAVRLDTLRAHHIYTIARIVVAQDPLLAERRPAWSVVGRRGGLGRDRRHPAPGAACNASGGA